MQSEARAGQATLAHLAAEGANAERIAGLAVSTWRDIHAALSPIIGRQGVSALYGRSLHLTHAAHPCLTVVHESALRPGEFDGLQTALSGQAGPTAAAAHDALLQTFHDLLIRLIGGSLTERLLRSVRHTPSSDHAAQDTLS